MSSNANLSLVQIAAILAAKGHSLSTAESCTGGLLAGLCTELSGSSAWFEGGVVSYSDALKQSLLQVSPHTLQSHGAVSQSTAEQMVRGSCQRLGTDYAIATTGIAGPTGGTAEKPVGLVWFAWGNTKHLYSSAQIFTGDRQSVRRQACEYALQEFLKYLKTTR